MNKLRLFHKEVKTEIEDRYKEIEIVSDETRIYDYRYII